MSRSRRLPALGLLAVVALALGACATPPASGGPDVVAPIGPGSDAPVTLAPHPPFGEVTAQGTVMEVGGEVELCLGAIAESYPPQCSGIPLQGWSWDGVEGSETASGVTWGAYAVQGTYDGETFTITQPPIMLALYDPMPFPDPTGGKPGKGTASQLTTIHDDVPDRFGDAYLMSYPDNGWLWIDVVWDDGTWQDAADAEFGEGVIVIRSALREVD